MTEGEAIARSRTGDHAAFAWIVREYKHMVHTIALRVLRQREEAEEAAQDAFVKAYRNLGSFQGGARFSTWLYSIAYRTAISQLRKRPDGTADLDGLPDHVGMIAPADPTGDRQQALDFALSQLPCEDAAVVSLYYLSEQSVDEIVTVTGLSASNVKVKLHRSRRKLFDVLKSHLKEELWTLHEE